MVAAKLPATALRPVPSFREILLARDCAENHAMHEMPPIPILHKSPPRAGRGGSQKSPPFDLLRPAGLVLRLVIARAFPKGKPLASLRMLHGALMPLALPSLLLDRMWKSSRRIIRGALTKSATSAASTSAA